MNTSNGAWLNFWSDQIVKTNITTHENYAFRVFTTIDTDRRGNQGSAQVWVQVRRFEEEGVALFTYQIERMNFYSLFFFIEQYQQLCWNYLIEGDYHNVIRDAQYALNGQIGPVIKVNGKRSHRTGTNIEVVQG